MDERNPLNGRRLYVRRDPNGPYEMWRAPDSSLAAFARDPFAHANTVSDAIAETAEIYEDQNDKMLWLVDGKPISVTGNVLLDISARHLATKRLVNRGTESEPNLVSEYVPYTPDQKTVRALMTADRREGGLRGRITKI